MSRHNYYLPARALFGRMDSSAFLLNPLDPPELRDSADQMEDECLLLTSDQAELLDTFRKDVRDRRGEVPAMRADT